MQTTARETHRRRRHTARVPQLAYLRRLRRGAASPFPRELHGFGSTPTFITTLRAVMQGQRGSLPVGGLEDGIVYEALSGAGMCPGALTPRPPLHVR